MLSIIKRESKKQDTKLLSVTSPNIDQFLKFFFTTTLSRKFTVKRPLHIPPHRRRYTTLQNIGIPKNSSECKSERVLKVGQSMANIGLMIKSLASCFLRHGVQAFLSQKVIVSYLEAITVDLIQVSLDESNTGKRYDNGTNDVIPRLLISPTYSVHVILHRILHLR